jgi:bifunctional UDP-N-acetylglucosamine pyrophosphorylase / glucosamine-1-phosphate N-acetyltransferase
VSDEPRSPAAVLILAAGEGTRMKSSTPKVLHTLCGRSMVGHAAAAARGVSPARLVVVVGHARELVTDHLAAIDPAIRPVVQDVQNGTGHAVRIAMEALAAQDGDVDGTVVVTYGDTPLLTSRTLAELIAAHEEAGNAATVLTAILDDPTGYGRILREGKAIARVVEQKDATAEQRAVREINSGVYAFDAKLLMAALSRLTASNAQGEEYLTDVVEILVEDGRAVGGMQVADPREILGANDRLQLAGLRRIMNDRITARWMLDGVTVVDPATTWIDVDVELARDVTLHPNTQLHGATRVDEGAQVGPNCTLTDTLVGAGANVTNTTSEGARIGPEAAVGPYTYLRPGTKLGRGAKAGGFVEMKNADVGEDSKVPHLSYIGDARIGVGTNIGAGTITANYDGVSKNRTEIGDHVFVGSDSVLIAPASVADGAYVAAGSAITDPVTPGSIAIARGRQRNVEGWVERKRPGTKTAQAAKSAREAAEREKAGAEQAVHPGE